MTWSRMTAMLLILILIATSAFAQTSDDAKHPGDLNCDGVVNLEDYAIFQRGFDYAQPPPSPTPAPTPKPSPDPSPNPTPTPPPSVTRSLNWMQQQIRASRDWTAPPGRYIWNVNRKGNVIKIPAGHTVRATPGTVIIDGGAPYNIKDVGSEDGVHVNGGTLIGVTVINAYRNGIKLQGSGAKVIDCYVKDCGRNNDNAEGAGIIATGKNWLIEGCRAEFCLAGIGSKRGASNGVIKWCFVYGTGWTSDGKPVGKNQENADGLFCSSGTQGTNSVDFISSVVVYAGDDGMSLSHSNSVTVDKVITIWTGYSPHTKQIPPGGEGDGTGFKCNDNGDLNDARILNSYGIHAKYRECDLRNGPGKRTVDNCVFYGKPGHLNVSAGSGGPRIVNNTKARRWHSRRPTSESGNDRNPQFANPDAPINTDWQGTGRATFDHVWDQVQRNFAIAGN